MEEYSGYLFVHFIGESKDGEQVYFSVSRDGLHWTDLNQAKPVLRLTRGEQGIRDPFILRGVYGDGFYLIGTELRIASGKGWHKAQYEGSRNLVVFHSPDLVNWSEPSLVEVGVEGAGCVWAPEALYDREKDAYMVFWASMVKEAGDSEAKQRIYCGMTKDFREFYQIRKYIEKENHVIDTTMLYDEGTYYRFSKDETTKHIVGDYGSSLWGRLTPVSSRTLSELFGVEGPILFRFNDRREYCLMADQFAAGAGYLPMVTGDLQKEDFRILSPEEYDMGQTKKRHGGIMSITQEEYFRLIDTYGI